RWPWSADSSRNDGPASRSLRKADTGVSQSSMNEWRSGMRLWARASSRTSSRSGATPGSSAATAIEDLLHPLDLAAAMAPERQQGVPVAVVAQPSQRLDVPARLALVPQLLPGAAPEVHLAGLARARERLGVHPRQREHLARAPVLHHARNQAPLVEVDLGIVH